MALTTAAIGPRDRHLLVDTASAAETPFEFRLDQETLRCTNGGGTLFWDVDRHVNGTVAVSHSSSTTITPVYPVEQTAAPLATPIVSPIATGQTQTASDDISVAKILTSATPALERLIRSELTLTPATSLAVAGTASLAAIRGCVTLSSGKELTDGYAYGLQGKFVGDGATISVGSAHVAGVLAQMSGNGMVATDGHIAIIIASGQNLPTSANVDAIYAESGGGKINSILKSNVKATYAFDITDFESGGIVAAAGTGGGAAGASGGAVATRVLKVLVDNAVAYIPLCSTNS